ncbi:MAG: hypothetical protein C0506_15775 [Anaerolinea sp.]|nr:hypothetical protein [Anaerolinea sp.]
MKRFLLVAALALLASVLPLSPAAGQTPAARSLLNVPFRGVAAPASTFDLVQSVTDFKPGAKSHVMTTGTPHYLSVLAGELTVDIDGKSEAVAAGKGVSAPAGAKLTLSNTGAANARLFAVTLLAVGAVADVHQLSAPGITTFATGRRTMPNAPAVVDIVLIGAEYDPGYQTPNHVMNEFHLMIHLAGRVGYVYLDGGSETYAAGSQGIMYEARPGYMRNEGQVASTTVWAWVANPGKPLTSAVAAAPAPGAPNTGNSAAQGGAAIPVGVAAAGLVLVFLGGSAFAAKRAKDAWRNG